MALRYSYTLIAPIYDAFVAPFTATARRQGLALLPEGPHAEVLLVGVGSGLDLPLLPRGPRYTGLDLTPAMLARARRKATTLKLDIQLDVGDARRLPYGDATFDVVVLHLILAVTPHPERVLTEAARVLRRGGRVLILDKFLRLGQKAPLRRLISPLLGLLATRTNVVFETVLARAPDLEVLSDQPALANGWFRRIVLRKTGFHDGYQIHHHRP
ncbi:class I SAM-dependent methyltransferase [Candidatus Competibacter phosphatis]|uniref:Class I SAM-dependent methyltransferase n=1 Tax=Candidatus Competibacter phosphatis TaxID=221280 RepID=A0ABX1TG97_9GAMM|nr:class I SAM-dependent methyltransferase [Candidatus Competibacter phosphatis]MCP5450888.1 methyltransferase domain-containing protein [Gammaproteobacteria bacterium]NMQ18372.1 class I SAM-dependent methyltransferase [Candidatus Competibacter phosphatis]